VNSNMSFLKGDVHCSHVSVKLSPFRDIFHCLNILNCNSINCNICKMSLFEHFANVKHS
jgi:hypothetical protein